MPINLEGQNGSGYYEDDDVSLNELIRRERIEGVQDTETPRL